MCLCKMKIRVLLIQKNVLSLFESAIPQSDKLSTDVSVFNYTCVD
jgi:hypothetical protein